MQVQIRAQQVRERDRVCRIGLLTGQTMPFSIPGEGGRIGRIDGEPSACQRDNSGQPPYSAISPSNQLKLPASAVGRRFVITFPSA
ncbi:hypothetical protein V2S04_07320 [Microbacterium sp. OR21]